MLTINLICVGKLKESFFSDAILEYKKRLSKYCKLNIVELSDEPIPNNASNAQLQAIKEKESKKIIDKFQKDSYIIALDLSGKNYTSEQFSEKLENLKLVTSSITFIIGGSLGLTQELLSKCDEKISFSKMTFPHQLIRVFLLEQIFRAFKIANNETYHR